MPYGSDPLDNPFYYDDIPPPTRNMPYPTQNDDFVLLRPRNGVGPNLSLDLHHSDATLPPRIHLDLYAEDQQAEVARLISLGATEVHWDKRPPDSDYVILADPEGNRFCVIDASE